MVCRHKDYITLKPVFGTGISTVALSMSRSINIIYVGIQDHIVIQKCCGLEEEQGGGE